MSCIHVFDIHARQIRSVYRTIELSEGFQGRLATSEAFFYGLDTLPLFIAIVIYLPFWPGRFIPSVDVNAETRTLEGKQPDEKVKT